MSFRHGKDTELWLDGKDLSTYFRSLELSAEIETAETTTFKKAWKTHIPGRASVTASMGGLYDPSMSDVRSTLTASAGAILTAGPHGMTAVGDNARLVRILTTSYAETAPVGDVIAFDWGVVADGDAGFGHTLAPLVARTTSANGTSYDGGAASSNGAVAHLHITAVSGTGATATVTIEHSTNNSTWTALGSFTAATAVGAQRIEVAGTVNRYLRAVWVLAGTTPSITFGVALARL